MSELGPIFVVGLPRSGSTLLSRILNDAPQIFSVNDLYGVQVAIGGKMLDAPLDEGQAVRLVDHLLSVVATRSDSDDAFVGQIRIPVERLTEIRCAILAPGEPRSWHEVMGDTLARVAATVGKSVWADKTPQNFLHIGTLRRCFPRARFVFLMRDPRDVLASYKFARGEGHDRRRYHPVPYSVYWRKAARRFLADRDRPDVMLIRYEDLVGEPQRSIRALARFLGTPIPTPRLDQLGHNSSFTAGRRRSLSRTETWICERVCRLEIAALGYPFTDSRPSIADAPDIALRGVRFCGFQLMRYVADADSRGRIDDFFRQVR